ncbi:hypothetical protein [Oceanicoccus sp. KOV_DT_Chl]|uniref:hypothetical protein n=1 Tax=Oceanicoccus sp. KOV_DT_Chl TaxID=1904639 RepID=UPI000C79AED9|nr:hypothetical protein [Oceanicoccus sp. KOV_DT_Chl]
MRIVTCLLVLISMQSPNSIAQDVVDTGWTSLESVVVAEVTGVVTLNVLADISAECGELFITFPYSLDTLAKNYYTALVGAKVAGLPVKITYYHNGSACVMTSLTLGAPESSI